MRSGWLWAAVLLTTRQAMVGQSEPAIPVWLANYPGVTAQTTAVKSLVESTYTAPAKPEAVSEHYRKLFEAQNLPFVPNFDGMGTVVRATAAEGDLMISIRAQGAGTLVRLDCTGKSAAAGTWTALPDPNSRAPVRTLARPVINPHTRMSEEALKQKYHEDYQRAVADDASYRQHVKDLNIHPVYEDAPAPPLVWPDWLVNLKGARLSIQQGVDRAKNQYLKSSYVTGAPMTALHAFYGDLLKAHDYPVHSGELSTGQTISGIVQNANGHVEGHNYPNGHPGPYTEIHVSYRRSNLNDPITVEMRFTTYAFKAPPPFER
jgi:hypothetical protein